MARTLTRKRTRTRTRARCLSATEEAPSPSQASSSSSRASPRAAPIQTLDAAKSNVKDDGGDLPKCTKCRKKFGMRTCSQLACFKCCDDDDCEGHRDRREAAKFNESVLDGTAAINRLAAEKRVLAARPGAFKDPAFHYLKETIYIWNFHDFMSVPKWRDEALRRSRKMRQRMEREHMVVPKKSQETSANVQETRKKRFRTVMGDLYRKSLLEAAEHSKDGAMMNNDGGSGM